jgi:hypothetical protein
MNGVNGTPGTPGLPGPTGATGPAGTTGQLGNRVFGTAQVTLNTANITPVTGVTQTFTVPANGFVYVSSQGGVSMNNTTAGAGGVVDVYLVVDGALDIVDRVPVFNNGVTAPDIRMWHLSTVLPALSAGSHTISISAVRVTSNSGAVQPIVGGNGGLVTQGVLNVMVLRP